MKLFILSIDYGYDGIETIGVFSSFKNADTEAMRLQQSNRLNGGLIDIEEYYLNKSYK